MLVVEELVVCDGREVGVAAVDVGVELASFFKPAAGTFEASRLVSGTSDFVEPAALLTFGERS